jgi:hypothetical protein
MSTPDYVTTTLDQADRVRAELIGSAVRSYQLATGALKTAAQQIKPDLQVLVDQSFGIVETAVSRSHELANSLVAATDRVGS